jgi:putative DNA primase/helicase
MRSDIKQRATGRWKGILLQLGFPQKQLSGKHCPCPICGGGEDRFRFDDREGRGTFICSKCGAGNGVDLVMGWKRIEFTDAAKLIEGVIGEARAELPRPVRDDAAARREMTLLWTRARPLDGLDLASRYLRSRGLTLAALPLSLRIVDALHYSDGDDKREFPAMLAKFVAPDNSAAILHRTWLAEPGVKADVLKPRKMMPGSIPPGGAVRLAPAEARMGVAEGIETALAAEQMHDMPVWATTSAGALGKWTPPPEAKEIVVFADSDASFTGQTYAYGLANRLKAAGLKVEVALPTFRDDGKSLDWNDALKAEQGMMA